MTSYGISLFGDLGVTYGGEPIPVSGSRQRSLLALLAINPNLTLSPDRIIEELWGDEPPGRPTNALRFHLSKLRSQVTPDDGDRNALIETQPGGYALTIDPEHIDTVQYAGLVERAETLLGLDAEVAQEAISQAEYLVSGPPLAEFQYEELARAFIARTDLVLHRGRLVAIDVAIARGDDDKATTDIRNALEEHPYDESLYRRLMLLQYRSGRSADALATYKEAQNRLGEDLGLELSPELSDLEEQILLHSVSPAAPARTGRLPAEVTSLIGRSALLQQASELLGANRWVALAGLPGSGKSRMALRLAHEAASAVWLEVPETDDLSELRAALRNAIQRSFPQLAVDPANPLAAIGGLETLFVFDEMQRSSATPDLITEVLEAGAGISVLTTTSTPTQHRDEWVLTVPALDPIAARDLMRDRLGQDAAISDLDLDESTGGLPGLIEAAAIAYRMGGSPSASPYTKPLVDTIRASLSTDAGTALARLALLQPPFDVIEASTAMGGKSEQALDSLAKLSDAGIVVNAAEGLAVHPLLRDQILSSLDQGDIEGMLRFIETRAARVDLSDRAVRHALDGAHRHSMNDSLDAALGALAPLWWNQGPRQGHSGLLRTEAWDSLPVDGPGLGPLLYLAAHLSLVDNDVPRAVAFVHRHAAVSDAGGPTARSRHDQLLGHLSLFTGDLSSATEALRRAARMALDADLPNRTTVVASLGFVELTSATGNLDGHADRVLLAAGTRPQDTAGPLAAELDGHRAWYEGDLDAADAHLSQAVSGYRGLGRSAWAVPATALLAMVSSHRGDPDRALGLLADEPTDEGVAAIAGAAAFAEALRGDADATQQALGWGARSLADGTNPIWTYRLLAAATHAARVLPVVGYDGDLAGGAGLGLAATSGVRIPHIDTSHMTQTPGDGQMQRQALEMLRRL